MYNKELDIVLNNVILHQWVFRLVEEVDQYDKGWCSVCMNILNIMCRMNKNIQGIMHI